MPTPEGSTYQISQYLTNLAVAMVPGRKQYIAKQLFSPLSVRARKGIYFEWDMGMLLRPEAKRLANAEPTPIGGAGGKTEHPYKIYKYGIGTNWTDEDLADVDVTPLGAAGYEAIKTRYVVDQALLRLELDTKDIIRGNSWGIVLQGTNTGAGANEFMQWDDDAAKPIALMKDLMRQFTFRTGTRPNVALIPALVLDRITEMPDLMGRVIYGGNPDRPATVTIEAVASLLGLERIIVSESVHDISKEGEARDLQYTWGADVWIGYVAPPGEANAETPSAGYQITWDGTEAHGPAPFSAAKNEEGIFINRFTTQRPAMHWLESYLFTNPKLVAPDMGILLKDAIPLPTWAS